MESQSLHRGVDEKEREGDSRVFEFRHYVALNLETQNTELSFQTFFSPSSTED